MSATPGDYELRASRGPTPLAEQIIRPTGLMDPKITVRPAGDQVDDLLHEVRARAERDERVLVTTLTKRMAEDLTEYYQQLGLRVRYLHSDIDTLDRVAIIRDLRLGKFDALVGINLLREGLDIPEVSLVAILDADKEGYLRSATSLIQTSGRAARNVNGEVIMYARQGHRLDGGGPAGDRAAARHPGALQRASTGSRRSRSARRSASCCRPVYERDYYTVEVEAPAAETFASPAELAKRITELEAAMRDAARRLDFEQAAELRDRVKALKRQQVT